MTYDTRIITELREAINPAELDQLRKDFEAEIRERNAAICERDAAILERDEARREVCEFELVNMKQAYEYATHRGWDCYKEKTQ